MGLSARWAGGGHGPDRCLGREERRPGNLWKGWMPPDEIGRGGAEDDVGTHCTPRAVARCGESRQATCGSDARRGVSLCGSRGTGSRRCQELGLGFKKKNKKTGREGPEARYNSSLFSVIALAKGAGSLEAFGARDEYRPAAIVMCSWLNIFFP